MMTREPAFWALPALLVGPFLAFMCVLGVLLIEDGRCYRGWERGFPCAPERRQEGTNSGGGVLTNNGPRWGFDGRIHLLPGLTPGIGF